MRHLSWGLLALAVGLVGFAYWGLYTVDGGHAFDEMAGMVPFAAGVLGALCGLGAAVIWWRSRARRH